MGGVVSWFCGCCSGQEHDPKSTTLVEDRSCTDKLILLLFLVGWAGSIAVISSAATQGGDPYKIINGVDFNGDICGYSDIVKDQPLAALVTPLSLDPEVLSVWSCVSDCSETENVANPFFASIYASTAFFGYCIPTFNLSASGSADIQAKSQFDSHFDSVSAEISRGISDLANAWAIILLSVFWALVFSYVYIWLTRRLAGVVIWLCILLVAVGGFFVGYSFLKAASDAPDTTSADRVQAYQWAGYVFIALTSLFVLVILGLSSRIEMAVEVVKEGSRAINDMKSIIFFPIIPLLMAAGYMCYWIYGALYIFSVSTLAAQSTPSSALYRDYTYTDAGYPAMEGTRNSVPSNYSSFEINDAFRPLAAYHFFHLLWSIQFLVYFGYTVLAGAVCAWYFTLTDEAGNKLFSPSQKTSLISTAFWRTVRYHLGSVAFAALIIAIVRFTRAVITYIETKTRTNPPSHLHKALFCVLKCFLRCVECCLDKISKNALVWVAMWGDPFLAASCSSFKLLWRNLSRVAAINVVSEVILLVGKVAIAAATIGVSALIMTNVSPWRETVSSAFIPCIIIGLIAYATAWIFFLTFDVVVDTTFLCFLVDSENSEKNGEAMFASKGLQELVGKYRLRSAMVAEETKKDAAERYATLGGGTSGGKNSAKVREEHEEAIQHLNRAVTYASQYARNDADGNHQVETTDHNQNQNQPPPNNGSKHAWQ